MLKSIYFKILKELTPVVEFIYRQKGKTAKSQMIFILGVPRSGSTILYQKLTNTLRYSYVDNFTHYATDKSFIGGNILSHKIFRKKPHDCFKSNYGNTSECGFSAPNEGSKFWRPIREKNNYEECKYIFENLYSVTKKPFVVKNLYNSIHLDKLVKVFPNALYIHLIREKEANIKSILKGREVNGIDEKDDWSVMPQTNKIFNSERSRVEFQYDEINRKITHDTRETENKIVLKFEEFIESQDSTIESIEAFVKQRF